MGSLNDTIEAESRAPSYRAALRERVEFEAGAG
jgi:hypothetical protein